MSDEKHPARSTWMRCVLDEYEGPLTRYAARITGDTDLARDVVQETFLRLWTEDPSRVDGRVAQWLYTVCRNRALDVRRKNGRMEALSEAQAESREAADSGPSVRVERREGCSQVLGALAQLPVNQQEENHEDEGKDEQSHQYVVAAAQPEEKGSQAEITDFCGFLVPHDAIEHQG